MYQYRASLESLSTELQLIIVRHLIFDDDTVEFGPFQQHHDGIYRRNLSMMRVSKPFYNLASSVLYGENHFSMSSDSILYHRYKSAPYVAPSDGFKTTRAVLSEEKSDTLSAVHLTASLERLDTISTLRPAQGMLQRLSIVASHELMEQIYDCSLVVILIRMRALRFLHFIFNKNEIGNGLRYLEHQGEGPESNGRRFLKLVDCDFPHVKEVTVEDSAIVDNATSYGAAFSQVVSALEERNEAWVEPESVLQTFWGGYMWSDGVV